MTCLRHVRAAMTERASSLRESILIGSTKKDSTQRGGLPLSRHKQIAKGAGRARV